MFCRAYAAMLMIACRLCHAADAAAIFAVHFRYKDADAADCHAFRYFVYG